MKKIEYTTDHIKLQQFLKLANVVSQGSDAKYIIQDGLVKVNGEVCTMRGKKIYDGDIISFENEEFIASVKN